MAEYVNYLSGITSVEAMQKYKKVLDSEMFLTEVTSANSKTSLMAGLHTLEIMKNGLLTVESCVLHTIAFHGN
jgi:hypothetical protein